MKAIRGVMYKCSTVRDEYINDFQTCVGGGRKAQASKEVTYISGSLQDDYLNDF